MRIALVKQNLLAIAAQHDQELDARDQREAFALAAVEHAEDLGRARLALALEQGHGRRVELAPRLVHRVEGDDRILEFVVCLAGDRLARAVNAVDVPVADILLACVLAGRHRALIDPLGRRAGAVARQAILAHEAAAAVCVQFAAVIARHLGRAGIAALPGPARLRDLGPIDDPGDGVAVGADFGAERAVGIASQRGALALVSLGGDHGFGGGRIGRGPFNRRGAADQIDAQVAGVAAPVDPEIGIAQVNRPGLRHRALRRWIVVAGINPGRIDPASRNAIVAIDLARLGAHLEGHLARRRLLLGRIAGVAGRHVGSDRAGSRRERDTIALRARDRHAARVIERGLADLARAG